MLTTATTITARALFALVKPYGPAIENGELVFDRDLPAELIPLLTVLHTGVRAILTHQQWWGSSDRGAARPRVEPLNIDEPIPDWCGLVCVAGDSRWDRIHPAARIDHAGLFARVAVRGG